MRVLNIYHLRSCGPLQDHGQYIGRGSPWGNPFLATEHGRERCLELFEEYAWRRLQRDPSWLAPLVGYDLLCFCSPKHCHGHILRRLVLTYGRRMLR